MEKDTRNCLASRTLEGAEKKESTSFPRSKEHFRSNETRNAAKGHATHTCESPHMQACRHRCRAAGKYIHVAPGNFM